VGGGEDERVINLIQKFGGVGAKREVLVKIRNLLHNFELVIHFNKIHSNFIIIILCLFCSFPY